MGKKGRRGRKEARNEGKMIIGMDSLKKEEEARREGKGRRDE